MAWPADEPAEVVQLEHALQKTANQLANQQNAVALLKEENTELKQDVRDGVYAEVEVASAHSADSANSRLAEEKAALEKRVHQLTTHLQKAQMDLEKEKESHSATSEVAKAGAASNVARPASRASVVPPARTPTTCSRFGFQSAIPAASSKARSSSVADDTLPTSIRPPPSLSHHSSIPAVTTSKLPAPDGRRSSITVSNASNAAIKTSSAPLGQTATVASAGAPASSAKGGSLSYSYPPPPSGEGSSLAYPTLTPHLTRAPLEILCKDPAVGRGVFATADIPAGQVVEISPVLVLSEKEYKGYTRGEEPEDGELRGVEASQLRGYVFTWGKSGEMAVALGLGSLFNHSSTPNVSYELKPSAYAIAYRAAKPIKAGEELCIFYGHSVRFSDSDDPTLRDRADELVDDGWGGLAGLGDGDAEDEDRLEKLKVLTEEELRERDNEIVGLDEEAFLFRKVTDIVDPEDAELSTFPCYAIDLPARHSGIIFQFVRKHSSRKFNELGHLKRVRPIGTSASTTPNPEAQIELAGEITSTDLPPLVPTPAYEDERDSRPNASEPVNDDQDTPVKPQKPIRDGSLAADMPVSVLLFPVSSSPSDLHALLTSSPLGSALSPLPVPEPYIINVPAQPARTDKQAEEWGRVWPVTIVHIREGAKAVRRKKGWERAKLEWIEREMRGVWDKAKEAGRRGEHPIACHVTDSWSPTYHTSLRPPVTLVTASDTRISTANCLSHAASNAIDAVAVLDLHDARPKLSPDAVEPPYVMTGLTVFLSHEPCLMCSMSLLHSRIKELYFVKRAPGSGGCGSLYRVHEDGGLNHRFEVWEWMGGDGAGVGVGIEELTLDP
ncbi:hypothetical protein JCM1841_000456 [Sporobolomyces salmonicolor]